MEGFFGEEEFRGGGELVEGVGWDLEVEIAVGIVKSGV